MASLEELADQIGAHFKARSRTHFRATLFVKLILLVGGATIAGISLAVEVADSVGKISGWTIAEIAALALVALGSVFVALTEKDASEALEVARDAVSQAQRYNEEIDKFQRVQGDIRRVSELYVAMNAMREVVSRALPQIDTIQIIALCLQVARRSLLIAFGFQLEEHWTMGVYVAETDLASGKDHLRLVAHERSIPCDLAQGRTWPIGVGVGGVAYAKSSEVIIPDLLDPALGSAFALGDFKKPDDDERYRSLAAVPIRTDDTSSPWGVAIATSDRPGHFSVQAQAGLQTVEALRALAGMVELVVRLASHLPRNGVEPMNQQP
jgi:GAF domain-containing protein